MNLGKLQILKKMMGEATYFADPFNYFMDEFAEKDGFLEVGKRVSHPKLEQLIQATAGMLVGGAQFYDFMFIRVPKHWFIHGTCWVKGRLASFIYF